MSQLDELLNNLSEGEIAAYSTGSEPEGHIVIGTDRYIIVPEALKRVAVQHDHDVETVTFDCPRYWDGLDMSKMQVYINYRLSDGTKGSYIAQNVAVDESDSNIMHFDWTLSRNATSVIGPIAFLVCIKKADAEGMEVNHWNSELNVDMYVSEGLECEEIPTEEYPDIVSQLLDRMDVVEGIATTEAMQGYVDNFLGADAEYFFDGNEVDGGMTINLVVDDDLHRTSTNPVQNKAVTNFVFDLADYVGAEIDGENGLKAKFKEHVHGDVDHVIETGEYSIWHYRKYASGFTEVTADIVTDFDGSGLSHGCLDAEGIYLPLPFAFNTLCSVVATSKSGPFFLGYYTPGNGEDQESPPYEHIYYHVWAPLEPNDINNAYVEEITMQFRISGYIHQEEEET